jgi:hypothetical protein
MIIRIFAMHFEIVLGFVEKMGIVLPVGDKWVCTLDTYLEVLIAP